MESFQVVVDFDGTVVTHNFPHIGKDIGAVPVLKELVNNGHKLILFTMRCDNSPTGNKPYLTDAVNWFKENGIPLWGIQTNPEQKHWTTSPKAHGDLFIDDLGLGIPTLFNPELSHKPYVDWMGVRKLLVEKGLLPANENGAETSLKENLAVEFSIWLRKNYDTHERPSFDEPASKLNPDEWRQIGTINELKTHELWPVFLKNRIIK